MKKQTTLESPNESVREARFELAAATERLKASIDQASASAREVTRGRRKRVRLSDLAALPNEPKF